MRSKHPSLAIGAIGVILLLCGALANPAAALLGDHDKLDDLIDCIEKTLKEMRESEQHLEKTLDAYHKTLAKRGGGRRSSYKDLLKRLEQHEERSKKRRERLKDMDERAEKYFKAWKKGLDEIKDTALKKRGAARLSEARERYRNLRVAGHEAHEGFEPVVEGLRDQAVYLGHDLNAASTATLAEDEAKISELAQGLSVKIASYRTAAKGYVTSLEP